VSLDGGFAPLLAVFGVLEDVRLKGLPIMDKSGRFEGSIRSLPSNLSSIAGSNSDSEVSSQDVGMMYIESGGVRECCTLTKVVHSLILGGQLQYHTTLRHQ